MSAAADALVRHFEKVRRERMQALPLLNDRLSVEAIGFKPVAGHELGVLLTPWFMNLVLLPGGDDWDSLPQGEPVDVELPSGRYEFTVTRDDEVGTFLSAILFRTVADFPSHEVARAVAEEIAASVMVGPDEEEQAATTNKPISRRELFTKLGTG